MTSVKTKNTKSKDNKETFENSKTSIVKKIWNITFWTLFSALLFVWIFDFVRVRQDEKPVFVIKEVKHEYSDGITTEYVGLGYKVYKYDRASLKIDTQFSPFFVGIEE